MKWMISIDAFANVLKAIVTDEMWSQRCTTSYVFSVFCTQWFSALALTCHVSYQFNPHNRWARPPSDYLLLFIAYTKLTTNATWSPIGESVAGIGSVGAGAVLSLNSPGPIVFDVNNNLYVNDYGHHRVIFYPSNGGTPSVVAGTGTAGSAMNQLSSPNGIAVDSSGTLYIVSPPYSYVSALRSSLFKDGKTHSCTLTIRKWAFETFCYFGIFDWMRRQRIAVRSVYRLDRWWNAILYISH